MSSMPALWDVISGAILSQFRLLSASVRVHGVCQFDTPVTDSECPCNCRGEDFDALLGCRRCGGIR